MKSIIKKTYPIKQSKRESFFSESPWHPIHNRFITIHHHLTVWMWASCHKFCKWTDFPKSICGPHAIDPSVISLPSLQNRVLIKMSHMNWLVWKLSMPSISANHAFRYNTIFYATYILGHPWDICQSVFEPTFYISRGMMRNTER